MLPIINKNTMLFDIAAEDKLNLIQLMLDKFDSEGYLCDKEQFHKDVLEREEIFSTYIDYGIGIPHGKSNGVEEPGVCIARLKNPIPWTDEENEKVDLVIMIAVRNQSDSNLHMQILSKLSRNLMHKEFRTLMKQGEKDDIYQALVEEVGE